MDWLNKFSNLLCGSPSFGGARRYFPNVTIMADRFHVVRLINHHFLKMWKEHDTEGEKKSRDD